MEPVAPFCCSSENQTDFQESKRGSAGKCPTKWKSWDYVDPYLRQILGFIGIEDVQTVRAEGMNIPPLAIHAVPNGEKAVEALVI